MYLTESAAGHAKLERVAAPDSATACQQVAAGDDRHQNAAAIGPRKAAERAGLTVLQVGVADDKNVKHLLLYCWPFSAFISIDQNNPPKNTGVVKCLLHYCRA